MKRNRSEEVFVGVALTCAFLLLLAPFTPRTSWVGGDMRDTNGTSGMRHSAGWDWVAPLCGVAAVVGLGAALAARSRVRISVTGAVVALAAFLVAMAAAGGHWLDSTRGSLNISGFVTHPAPGALPFAIVALVGATCALALVIHWVDRSGVGS